MHLLLLLLLLFTTSEDKKTDWKTPFEKGNGNQTATYAECIAYYQKLDAAYPEVSLKTYGTTDIGKPLHLVVLSEDGDTDPVSVRNKNKRILLIQNGIHPGEPEGIDASMMLARDYVQQKPLRKMLENVVVLIIPVYNVGGMLNRNAHTRTNQNGPEMYGFRGNARNLDLNRDYIKAGAKNTQAFYQIFREWQPDIFVDTHTSNGADYQYTMTLIATQKDKLQPQLSQYMQQSLLPALYKGMEKRKSEMIPYVDFHGETPESGINGFLETPRYASGYTTLFNTIGFITETHMLKPFPDRVKATYTFLDLMIKTMVEQQESLKNARKQADYLTLNQQAFVLTWKPDTTQTEKILFKGYAAGHKKSDVSGLDRLYYDRSKPFARQVSYRNTYQPAATVTTPRFYLIPQAWTEVIDRLKLNKVVLKQLKSDSLVTVETYFITDYKTSKNPYEGHYLHYDVQVKKTAQKVQFYKGDYLISTSQPARRFLVETLEPHATDSYFNWNFFDSVLQQKEWFSDYVFEDRAAELLKQNPEWRQQLEEAKKKDPELAKSAWAQLYFIYKKSPHYEPSHMRYPVFRLN